MKGSQKRFSIVGAICALSLTISAQSATSNPTYPFLDQVQVRSTSASAPMLLAIINGKITTVQMGSGITLNTSTATPTLTVSATSGPTLQVESYSYTAAATSQTLKFIPVTTVPMLVARNGVVLTAGIDYSAPASGTGVVRFSVSGKASLNAPVAGDIFTFYYAH